MLILTNEQLVSCLRTINNQMSSTRAFKEATSYLNHPLIVKVIETYNDSRSIYVLMNLVQGGKLRKTILDNSVNGRIGNASSQFYAACVLEAVAHLHSHKVAHRDIKPDHLMLNENGYCILTGLGTGEYRLMLLSMDSDVKSRNIL